MKSIFQCFVLTLSIASFLTAEAAVATAEKPRTKRKGKVGKRPQQQLQQLPPLDTIIKPLTVNDAAILQDISAKQLKEMEDVGALEKGHAEKVSVWKRLQQRLGWRGRKEKNTLNDNTSLTSIEEKAATEATDAAKAATERKAQKREQEERENQQRRPQRRQHEQQQAAADEARRQKRLADANMRQQLADAEVRDAKARAQQTKLLRDAELRKDAVKGLMVAILKNRKYRTYLELELQKQAGVGIEFAEKFHRTATPEELKLFTTRIQEFHSQSETKNVLDVTVRSIIAMTEDNQICDSSDASTTLTKLNTDHAQVEGTTAFSVAKANWENVKTDIAAKLKEEEMKTKTLSGKINELDTRKLQSSGKARAAVGAAAEKALCIDKGEVKRKLQENFTNLGKLQEKINELNTRPQAVQHRVQQHRGLGGGVAARQAASQAATAARKAAIEATALIASNFIHAPIVSTAKDVVKAGLDLVDGSHTRRQALEMLGRITVNLVKSLAQYKLEAIFVAMCPWAAIPILVGRILHVIYKCSSCFGPTPGGFGPGGRPPQEGCQVLCCRKEKPMSDACEQELWDYIKGMPDHEVKSELRNRSQHVRVRRNDGCLILCGDDDPRPDKQIRKDRLFLSILKNKRKEKEEQEEHEEQQRMFEEEKARKLAAEKKKKRKKKKKQRGFCCRG